MSAPDDGGTQPRGARFLQVRRSEMAANCLCFLVGAVAPVSVVSWLIAFH